MSNDDGFLGPRPRLDQFDVERAVVHVRETIELWDDREQAHRIEDLLYHDFARFVAHGEPVSLEDLQKMAREMLKTRLIHFPRYCA